MDCRNCSLPSLNVFPEKELRTIAAHVIGQVPDLLRSSFSLARRIPEFAPETSKVVRAMNIQGSPSFDRFNYRWQMCGALEVLSCSAWILALLESTFVANQEPHQRQL